MTAHAFAAIEALRGQLSSVLAGKGEAIEGALLSLLAGGHLLIEDLPGMGKTTLAHGLAASLATSFGRIQFTADLLPADIIGVEIYDPAEKQFVFHPGPVFHHIVLADEINRATPKAQSALLEAMAEGQVSSEGQTRALPDPFFVMARKTPWNIWARSRCLNRSWIDFLCAFQSAIRIGMRNAGYCWVRRGRLS